MTFCAHCHQPIVETPLQRLMADLRRLNHERTQEEARRVAGIREPRVVDRRDEEGRC